MIKATIRATFRASLKATLKATTSLGARTRLGLVLASALVSASCVHQVQIVQSTVPGQAQNLARKGRTRTGNQMQTVSRAASRNAVSSVMQLQIQNAIDAGEGDLEARALRQRLAANADDLDARLRLARLYSNRGLPDLAIEHYRLAAVRFPDSVAVALGLAKTLDGMGETEEALKAVAESLRNQPRGNWELLSLRGILEDQSGRSVEADASHRAALALEPGNGSLHNNLGYNLLTQGRSDEAAAEFRRAIEIDPRSEIAHNNLGAALASQSAPAQKEALLELQRSSSPAIAHNNLAAVLMGQGRHAEARVELESALRMRPDFPAALSNLKLVAYEDGQPITFPVASPPVNFWKRAASWARLIAGTSPPKPAVSGGGPADGAAAGKD
jgi:Flp pilus assembly protein TadD